VELVADGPHVQLSVRDDGIGIEPDLAPRIFDLFVQGERDLDRAQGGLGIGLTLVKRLTELHGGTVTLVSKGTGQGSEFTVRLPAVDAPAMDSDHGKPAQGQDALDILVVEDNEDARETLVALLEILGHRVSSRSDGVAGLEAALASPPDLALVDVGLPRMDGYEVARRLRTAIGTRTRLVALTGYGSPEDRERALAAGFDAHVVKPVDAETLRTLFDGAGKRPSA